MIKLRMQTGYAEVCDKGAHLSALFMDNKEILKGSSDGVATHGGSAVLIPYAGRVKAGRYSFNGRNYSLPLSSDGHAIHGLVLSSKWVAVSISSASVVMTTRLKHEGYPSPLELSVKYAFSSPASFQVEFVATNAGFRDAPIVIGAHPYFFAKKWSLHHEGPVQRLLTEEKDFPNGELEDFSFNGNALEMNSSTTALWAVTNSLLWPTIIRSESFVSTCLTSWSTTGNTLRRCRFLSNL